MAFGNTPRDDENIPLGSVYVPNTASSDLTALQGGPASTDGNGQLSAPASMYLADGADVTQGTSADANTVASVMGRLTKIRDLLNAALTVSVSGTVNATQSGTWTVQPGNTANTTAWKVDGSAVTQPVQLQSGGNLAGSVQIIGNDGSSKLKINGSGTLPIVEPDQSTSGTITASGNSVQFDLTDGIGTIEFFLAGTFSVGSTIVFEQSADNTNWVSMVGRITGSVANQPINTTTGPGPIAVLCNGVSAAHVRARCTAFQVADSINVTIRSSTGVTAVAINSSLPAGTASIGAVTANQGGAPWSENITQIGGASLSLGSKTSANSIPVVVASDQAAVPVSGTVTANAGTNLNTSALALDTSVNGILLSQGATTSGEKGPLVQGAVTTSAPSYTTTQTSPISLTTAGAIRTDASATTQPVSGTITANAGTNLNTSTLALETGGNLATVAGAVTASKVQVNLAQYAGSTAVTGTGQSGAGVARVTVSNDSKVQVWDGTNGPAAVKLASTPPTLADKANVIALSPNNTGLPVNTPAIVQKTNSKSTGSVASLALAFGSNNVAGNSIIVVCGVGNGTAPTISDSAVNTYTQAAQTANSTALNVAVFYAVNVAGSANTVTVNNGGSTASIVMEIYEVSGLIAQVTAQPDQTATNTGNSGTASTSAISALSPNEYAFAAVGIGTAAQTITAGSGWTNDSGQQNPTTPAGLFSFVSLSQYLASLKAVTPQATFTSEPWAMAVATFRPVLLGVEGTTKITDGTTTMAFGQATMANSLPVTLASNQSNINVAISSIAAALSQANQIPVADVGQQGLLTLSAGSLTANADNPLTFSGNSTVARRIRIQNESAGTIYWNADATASTGSPSLVAPAANAVIVEWVNMAITTLHIWIPSGGTTTLNGSGGVKVSAWA